MPDHAETSSSKLIISSNAKSNKYVGSQQGWIADLSQKLDCGAHTRPIESGSLSMEELNEVMKWDDALQQSLVHLCAEMLDDTVQHNEERKKECELKAFVGKAPRISPAEFVKRITKHSQCSTSCLVVACIYLQRLKDKNPKTYMTGTTFQKLFGVAAMVASKFLDEIACSNKHWAEIVGITMKQMNALEVEFLFRLSFELNVTREDYDFFADAMSYREGCESRPRETSNSKLQNLVQKKHIRGGENSIPKVVNLDQGRLRTPSFKIW
eukprot:CAMPEP_0196759092 /NCGR_PEP_ID=MMETSP1091-20130531/104525_1 /TAXON_ID=302021 /ORGANISM="Rhodomonas sp., Strain CCMP768" /LENGTH=267 /DNA_ID=CAMNT_0042107933 /DNA_START=20 /DNA_END=820 /DNA_ORIENTATION=+